MLYSAKCHEEGVRIYLGFHSDTPPPLIGRRLAEQKIQLCCALQVESLRTDPMCSSFIIDQDNDILSVLFPPFAASLDKARAKDGG